MVWPFKTGVVPGRLCLHSQSSTHSWPWTRWPKPSRCSSPPPIAWYGQELWSPLRGRGSRRSHAQRKSCMEYGSGLIRLIYLLPAWRDQRKHVWAVQFSRANSQPSIFQAAPWAQGSFLLCSHFSKWLLESVIHAWRDVRPWGSVSIVSFPLSLSLCYLPQCAHGCHCNMQCKIQIYLKVQQHRWRGHDHKEDQKRTRHFWETGRTSARLSTRSSAQFFHKAKNLRPTLGSLLYPQSKYCDCVGYLSPWWRVLELERKISTRGP